MGASLLAVAKYIYYNENIYLNMIVLYESTTTTLFNFFKLFKDDTFQVKGLLA